MLPLTPTKLGRYEIVDEIGKGAMGVVYLARDPLIGRLVALKTFRIGYSVRDQELEQFRARFIREAQSAGILTHPNIVTIHDVVEESEEGLAFIAMEYVRGTNLKALLQGDQPLTLPFVADVIAQVADALDYAHSHRVIHRDVKPANILITADNRVKITDFGIARLDTSNLTQEGQLLGTPNYMSPEQIQGKDVDHRADLFALGVVLYEMLTRHKPFQGENLTVVSHRIVYDHFTPPREYLREMPAGIEPVLNRALDKDPNRRYQRAKEMVDDLRRVVGALAGEDLNETQSLASFAVPLIPPPPIPGSDTTGALGRSPGSTAGLSASPGSSAAPAVPPPAPAAAQAAAPPPSPRTAPRVAKPPRTGPLVSPRRVFIAGGSAAFLTLLVGAVFLLGLAWLAPQKGRDAQEDSSRTRFLDLVRTGTQLLHQGDAENAAIALREAEKIQPNRPKVHNLRLTAERQAAEAAGTPMGAEQAQEKIAQLGLAQQALAARRWDEAINAANAVLAIDPNEPNAKMFLAAAQDGLAKAKAAPAPRTPKKGQPQIATATPPAYEPALQTPSTPVQPVSQDAILRISFSSDLAGATVMVYVNGDKLIQESVGGGGGFLRRNQGGGRIDRSYTVKAGEANIKVYVTPPNHAAIVKTISGNFIGGSSRQLDIRLPESKVPAIDLN